MLGKLPHKGTWCGSGRCWPPALESQRQQQASFKTLVVLVWQSPLSRLLKVPEACTLMCTWGPVYCQHPARVGPDKNTNFTDKTNYGHMGFSENVTQPFFWNQALHFLANRLQSLLCGCGAFRDEKWPDQLRKRLAISLAFFYCCCDAMVQSVGSTAIQSSAMFGGKCSHESLSHSSESHPAFRDLVQGDLWNHGSTCNQHVVLRRRSGRF